MICDYAEVKASHAVSILRIVIRQFNMRLAPSILKFKKAQVEAYFDMICNFIHIEIVVSCS